MIEAKYREPGDRQLVNIYCASLDYAQDLSEELDLPGYGFREERRKRKERRKKIEEMKKIDQEEEGRMNTRVGRLIYFISDGTAIKIGSSGNIKERLEGLQQSNPRKVYIMGTMVGSESKIHDVFKKDRIRGEWFRKTPRLSAFIRDNCNNPRFRVRKKIPLLK